MDAIPEKDKAKQLIENMQKYGVFVVPTGELESWIEPSSDDRTWIVAALQEISEGNYGENGLQQFCAKIDKYLSETYDQISGDESI